MREFDFIVIGSGIAGLTFALKAAEKGSVALVTKRKLADSNTAWAQGGVACVVSEEDSFDLHIQDTLVAGAGLCNEEAVRAVVTEGPARIAELMKLGMHFDERELEDGGRELDLGAGGRAFQAPGAAFPRPSRDLKSSGPWSDRFPAIRALPFSRITWPSIFSRPENWAMPCRTAASAFTFSTRKPARSRRCEATSTCWPPAGAGRSTFTRQIRISPPATEWRWPGGRARSIANMEFVQFHPTCLYHTEAKSFLISEAVRGEGGILLDAKQPKLHGAVSSENGARPARHRRARHRCGNETQREQVRLSGHHGTSRRNS